MNTDQAFQLAEDFRGRMVKYRTENAALKAEVERLRGALEGLLYSSSHEPGCQHQFRKECECGFNQAAKQARAALAPSDPQPATDL